MFETWTYDDGLSGSKAGAVIGTAGSIGSKLIPALSTGAWAGPIGMGVGLVAGLIAGIFAKHAAKVRREDEVTGVWAATGQQAIDETMALYRSGQARKDEVLAGFDSIEAQYEQLMREVSKYNGKFGQFPDVNGPRPSRNCNAACGIRWDLHQQLNGLRDEVRRGGDRGLSAFNLGGPGGSSMLPLVAIGALALWALS